MLRQYMDSYEIPEALRPGVVSIVSALRAKNAFNLEQVALDILTRMADGLVSTQAEMDRLVGLFEKARVADVIEFLYTPDMTVDGFADKMREGATVEAATRLADQVQMRLEAHLPFSPEELKRIGKVRALLVASLGEPAST